VPSRTTENAPTFRGLSAASAASSYAKQRNRARDTTPEKTLRAILWHSGLRYRRNVAGLLGKPDIVFPRCKVAVFCDGDFWHGRNWKQLSKKLAAGANPSYWHAKIKTNRDRDVRTTKQLQEAGWTVLRFWETDIHRDAERIARDIAQIVCRKRKESISQTPCHRNLAAAREPDRRAGA
jgi:DNA mismatch endonuclease (patch repair protein)